MFTEQAMINALFTRRMEREHKINITLPIRPTQVKPIVWAENESGSDEEEMAILNMLAIGKAVLCLAEIVEGNTPAPASLCSLTEDEVVYSFVSKLVTVPTAHYGDILLYQDFIVPGMLSDAYTKMKDGGRCSRTGHKIVHLLDQDTVYTNI